MKRWVNFTRIFFIVAIAASCAISPCAVHAEPPPDSTSILKLICEPSDIKGAECLKAKFYPTETWPQRDCNVLLLAPGYTGRFLPGQGLVRVIPYTSICEPHAANWGGSLVLSVENGALRFRSYQTGVVTQDCAIVSKKRSLDRLICLTSYLGQGIIETSVAEIRFSQTFTREVSLTHDIMARARHMGGSGNPNAVVCNEDLTLFHYDKLFSLGEDDKVGVVAEHADRSAIEKSCLAEKKVGDDVATAIEMRQGRFVIDINTHQFTPEATYLAELANTSGKATFDADSAGKRIALVVGNSAYEAVPHLTNPDNDAELIAGTLRELKFAVVSVLKNVTKPALQKALITFSDEAANADWAIIYFAGHGIEVDGQNFAIPVDAALKRDAHVKIEAVALDELIEATSGARLVRMVILDACRENPFLKRIIRSVGVRSIGGSLAAVEPQKATLVAYSTKHGSLAQDGQGANSPFAAALARHIKEPALDIGLMFRRVRDSVLTITDNQQEPFTYGSLPGHELSFYPVR